MLFLGVQKEWGILMPQLPLEFRNCLFDINMEELVTKGAWFTWSNRRGGGGANMSKIDRVVVNASWLDTFPDSEALAHSPGISDHCSLLVTVCKDVNCKKPFKFFNFWMKHHKFKELVSSSWSIPISGSAMLRVSLKLKRLKPILSDLNATCFSNISGRVVEARQNLEHFQRLCNQSSIDQDTNRSKIFLSNLSFQNTTKAQLLQTNKRLNLFCFKGLLRPLMFQLAILNLTFILPPPPLFLSRTIITNLANISFRKRNGRRR